MSNVHAAFVQSNNLFTNSISGTYLSFTPLFSVDVSCGEILQYRNPNLFTWRSMNVNNIAYKNINQ